MIEQRCPPGTGVAIAIMSGVCFWAGLIIGLAVHWRFL